MKPNKNKNLLKLTIWGGAAFWATTIACSLLPIAAKYRAAYSDWSMQTVWIASLPMGLLIGYCVSYILLHYFDKLPFKSPLLKSILISFIFLIMAILLIDVPQSFFGMSKSALTIRFFFVGVLLNGVRFLLLGIVIGYIYNDLLKLLCKGNKK